MRLFELLENVPSYSTRNRMRMPKPNDPNNPRVSLKGSGSYARVFQDRDNPHEVMKFSSPIDNLELQGVVTNNDGYIDYLQEIAADESIQDNPWVPRILSFRLHKNNDGKIVDFSVRLEALHQFDTLSIEEIFAMSERIFTPFYHSQIFRRSTAPKNGNEYIASLNFISMMNRCINVPDISDTISQDENLKEFAYWHAAAHKRRQRGLDIRQPNVMIRRTPYGVQPVITDPWA